MDMSDLTPDELRDWMYVYRERLGILCGSAKPTAEQREIAEVNANSWLNDKREEEIQRRDSTQ